MLKLFWNGTLINSATGFWFFLVSSSVLSSDLAASSSARTWLPKSTPAASTSSPSVALVERGLVITLLSFHGSAGRRGHPCRVPSGAPPSRPRNNGGFRRHGLAISRP